MSQFREEVEQYVAAFVGGGGGSGAAFHKGISTLAARRDISDWESDPDIWTQLGRGLGRSELAETEALAYGAVWSAGDAGRTELIRRAFFAAR